ncbi:hypothetical protein [Yinghuangia seranimata]|uniref:hypothetical protein n=1 Tax=Yinghuangia seranimata TaxID=408067 RepID=UPI00248D28DC|nr:hypothetical protein [Yinghuangia seranimata]MDI2130295.1 hypothetical protein [Yinghuangia seranimata]
MRRPASRYMYVRREPTVIEFFVLLGPAVVLTVVGWLVLLLLLAVTGPGGAAVVWLCGFLALTGIAHALPELTLLRWGWLVAGAAAALTW